MAHSCHESYHFQKFNYQSNNTKQATQKIFSKHFVYLNIESYLSDVGQQRFSLVAHEKILKGVVFVDRCNFCLTISLHLEVSVWLYFLAISYPRVWGQRGPRRSSWARSLLDRDDITLFHCEDRCGVPVKWFLN